MLNKAILVGRLVRDPEIRSTANGVSVVNFTIAILRKYKDPNGDRQSDFINCVAFRGTADFISQYFAKGDMISVDGEIQTRTWDDNEGKRNYVTEVLVSGGVNFVAGTEKKSTDKQENDGGTDTGITDFGLDAKDDDLPF